jgi:hypothetical protein
MIIQVFFRPEAMANSRMAFELIDCGSVETFEEFENLVSEDHLFSAERLDTRWGAVQGERIIERRMRMTFRGSAVARAQEPVWRIVDLEG